MKRIITAIIVLALLLVAAFFVYTRFFISAEFRAQATPAPACKAAMFDKSALVFDTVLICGTSGVPAEKLSYAANVAAQWLDNDEDGQPDEARLIEAMKPNNPVVIMSANGFSGAAFPQIMSQLRDSRLQDLSAAETNPEGDRRDASQEEIHHVIMNSGWQELAPDIFSEKANSNSKLYKAWKFANDNAHYAYDDPTCDDSCKVTEFVYLATAAYLGSDADLESDEMRLKTREALQTTIPEVIEIFESEDYVYPILKWPDGNYPHQDNLSFFGIKPKNPREQRYD